MIISDVACTVMLHFSFSDLQMSAIPKAGLIPPKYIKEALGPIGLLIGSVLAGRYIEQRHRDEFSTHKGKSALFRERKVPEGEDPWKY